MKELVELLRKGKHDRRRQIPKCQNCGSIPYALEVYQKVRNLKN